MDETGKTWPAPELPAAPARLGDRPGDGRDTEAPTAASPSSAADETDPFGRAESQIEELFRRFAADVGGLIGDAQSSVETARTARADAERIRQEAIKLHADAAAAALRIIGAARAEAGEIREEAKRRLEMERSVGGIVEELERLAEAIGGIGNTIDEVMASEDVIVMPDASGKASAA